MHIFTRTYGSYPLQTLLYFVYVILDDKKKTKKNGTRGRYILSSELYHEGRVSALFRGRYACFELYILKVVAHRFGTELNRNIVQSKPKRMLPAHYPNGLFEIT